VWDDFCAWYLEIIKPEFGKPIDETTYNQTISFFESVLKLLHPFMPFITEELWHELKERKQEDCVMVSEWPKAKVFDNNIISQCEIGFDVVTQVRNVRNAKGLSPKESLSLSVNGKVKEVERFASVIKKLSNLKEINSVAEKLSNATSFMVGTHEFYIPLEGKVDAKKEREEILKDLEYNKGFLASVDKKLSNEKFVNGAPPQVIELERKKKADAESKIKSLEERLNVLK
jgi:valyl-tRNA synthetase